MGAAKPPRSWGIPSPRPPRPTALSYLEGVSPSLRDYSSSPLPSDRPQPGNLKVVGGGAAQRCAPRPGRVRIPAMLAQTVVRTVGINWESVGTIVGALTLMLGLMYWLIGRRDKARDVRDADIKQLIGHAMSEQAEALNHQTEMLLAKLETKETVARISERLARVEVAAGLKASHNG